MNIKLLINIKKLKRSGIKAFLFFISAFLIVSCRLDIPAKQMSLARSSITRAVEVKSEKYAPEELQKAKDQLIRSHDSMKTDDVKASKKAAEDSLKYSIEAIEKSLPLLADDTLNEARAVLEEADLALAEKYAAEEFSLAAAKITESESLLTEKKYWESYLKSQEAIINSISARDKALSNIAALKENINRITEEAKSLEFIGGREFAPDDMNEIDLNLEDASFALEKKNIKEASARITDAEESLKAASQKTWQGVASAKIKAAEEAMQNLEKSSYKESFIADIEKSNSLIKESKDLYEANNYKESSLKADEALTIMNSIAIAIEKKSEEKRLTQEGEEEIRGEDSKIDAALSGEASEYTVKYNPNSRDCLWRIAMSLYKDARLWPLIYMANKDSVKGPDLIFPGQKLKIPSIRMTGVQKEKPAGSDKTGNNKPVVKRESIQENNTGEDVPEEKSDNDNNNNGSGTDRENTESN
jgi:nucleoid-associated protein YgaU